MSEQTPGLLDGAIAPAENTRLFGHDAAEEFLAQSYRSGKGHHAILIEGPEGIGKATLAFRFAHHVLSHPDPAKAPERIADPDPTALEFRQIAAGASHNLLHLTRPIDSKTGRMKTAITVDEVRRAGRFFAQTTGSDGWRIVIVDTADDLNRNAANAILKILEEPPRRSLFLVLSHAPGKLLPTIRSRCLPLMLRPLGDEDLLQAIGHLGMAAEAGQRGVSESGGSVGQFLKLVNYGGLEIIEALDSILSSKGGAQRRAMHRVADAVSQKDNDTLFDFFIDHVGELLVSEARKAALSGSTSRAASIADQHGRIAEWVAQSEAYNLDRKQTILSLLEDVVRVIS
jgi:DNA polymerase-3 subunit delta'